MSSAARTAIDDAFEMMHTQGIAVINGWERNSNDPERWDLIINGAALYSTYVEERKEKVLQQAINAAEDALSLYRADGGSTDAAVVIKSNNTEAPAQVEEIATPWQSNNDPAKYMLMPRYGLALYSGENANTERFAMLFRATWKRLPKEVKSAITRHWSNMRYHAEEGPSITVADCYSYRQENEYGHCRMDGYNVYFVASILEMMPDHVVQDTIAHEFVHMYCRAIKAEWDHTEDHEDSDLVEATLYDWDFDPDAIYCWERDNCATIDQVLTRINERHKGCNSYCWAHWRTTSALAA